VKWWSFLCWKIDYGLFDNILYVCVIFHVFLFDRVVVFGIVTVSSAGFYVITLNQEYFHMNKIRNSTRKMESDSDLVDYDDWNFVNSILHMN
jgi:hypothetical protein